ncbi:hypothetical protein AUK22_11250 [bacterium CG2_30_54_10]|nr:MAG: hypothetical protein AUK22_11250 [bacterium CG2_30_54_10]
MSFPPILRPSLWFRGDLYSSMCSVAKYLSAFLNKTVVSRESYLLKKKRHWLVLNIKRDSSHSFEMTNDAVVSTEGRNLLRQESLS